MGEGQSKVKNLFKEKKKQLGNQSAAARSVEEVYDFRGRIGSGSFSDVHKTVHKEENIEYAIKEIDKKKTNNEDRLKKEINLLSIVNHPNIIRFKEVYHTASKIFLVTEIAEGGELFDRIMERETYCEKNAAVLVGHMLSAIAYMHEHNFVHRDLKPENILLKSKDDDTTIKIIDFGLATIVTDTPLRAACGTPMYSAPEVIDAKRRGYGLEADVWSIGVITYILLCGYPPFVQNDGETVQQLFQKILGGRFTFHDDEWKGVSEEAKDFIRKLLVVDPKGRMTAKEALTHPWIVNAANYSTENRLDFIKSFSEGCMADEIPHDADSENYNTSSESGDPVSESEDLDAKSKEKDVDLQVLESGIRKNPSRLLL